MKQEEEESRGQPVTGKDKQSHLVKHALTSNDLVADLQDLMVIDNNCHENKYKRKISEVLYIKQDRLSLNAHEQSVQLKLYI